MRTFISNPKGRQYWFNPVVDFKRLRRFILLTNPICKAEGLVRLVNITDDIRDLKVGQTIFVCPSAYEPYAEKSLGELNRVCAMMHNAVKRGELPVEYMPEYVSAFLVKRTARTFIYQALDYEY